MRKPNIAFIIFVSFVILAAYGCQGSKKAEEAARPVITVGSRTITLGEYKSALASVMPEVLAGLDAEETRALKNDLVARLIEEALILDEAVKLGLSVTDEELEAEAASLKNASGGEGFDEGVRERFGTIEKWKAALRKELLVKKVIAQVVEPRIEVTSKEALAYYRENPDEFSTPDQVRARMIVLGTEEEARELKRKLTPANFAEVAREVSLSPESASGGDLGYFGKGDMPVEFEDVVFKMRTGTISDIIKTDYGYHIFYLEGQRKGGRRSFNEVKDSIIDGLRTEYYEREFEDWISALKENARIEIREELL